MEEFLNWTLFQSLVVLVLFLGLYEIFRVLKDIRMRYCRDVFVGKNDWSKGVGLSKLKAVRALVLAVVAALTGCAGPPAKMVDGGEAPLRTSVADTTAMVKRHPELPPGASARITAGTVISLALDREISTKNAKPGDGYAMHVAEDVLQDDRIVIPKGAVGYCEVIHAQRSGMFGKPAELLLAVRWVEVHGQRIPMRHFRPQTGESHERDAFAMSFVPVVGLFAAFVRGGEIVLPPGARADAEVVSDTEIHVPALDRAGAVSVPSTI